MYTHACVTTTKMCYISQLNDEPKNTYNVISNHAVKTTQV